MTTNKEIEKRMGILDVMKPINSNISAIDIAYQYKGKFVEVYIGNRHYQGTIIEIDDYFNVCLDDGNKLHFFKANKINEIAVLKGNL